MSLQQLYEALLVGGLVVLVGIVATRVASRAGLPSLLLFLALGVVLGEDVIGIKFDDAQLAQDLGTAALAVILVEGGLTTDWSEIRAAVAPAGLLATLGVGVSTVVTAAGAHLVLDLGWQQSLLLGAIVSSTDAAAVFSTLRVLPLPRRVAGVLEAESGFNDAPSVILVILLSATPFDVNGFEFAGSLAYELAAGAAIGLAVVGFAAAGAAHASGFLAAYLAALVLANAGLPHRAATRSFAEGIAWLAQIGLFVLLGLLVTPSELPRQILPALAVGFVLLLVARPLAVVASLTGFRVPWREQAFLSVAGLRGAVPIVLATFPIVKGVPDSDRLLNIVFVLVVLFTVVQGPSLAPLARRLRLVPREVTREILVESAPLDVLDAELLTMTVASTSRLHAVSIIELRLPEPSVVTLIIRSGKTFVPDEDTQLHSGDELLVVTTRTRRAATERRLRAVSRRGPLAHWFEEYGDPD
jgi:cell volume regulation protein A